MSSTSRSALARKLHTGRPKQGLRKAHSYRGRFVPGSFLWNLDIENPFGYHVLSSLLQVRCCMVAEGGREAAESSGRLDAVGSEGLF